MIELFPDIKITLKSGQTIVIPGDDLAFNENLPKFLSMQERYEKSIERINGRKGVLRIDIEGNINRIDLTQIKKAMQVA